MRYIDADKVLQCLPDDLPYKASVKRVLIQALPADVVEKSLFTELKSLIEKAEFKSDSPDAERGAKFATEQIAYFVSEFIRIKVNGG